MILKCNGVEIEFDSYERIDERTVALYKDDKPGYMKWKVDATKLSDFGKTILGA